MEFETVVDQMVEFQIVDMEVVFESPGHFPVNEKHWDIVPKELLGAMEWDFDPSCYVVGRKPAFL